MSIWEKIWRKRTQGTESQKGQSFILGGQGQAGVPPRVPEYSYATVEHPIVAIDEVTEPEVPVEETEEERLKREEQERIRLGTYTPEEYAKWTSQAENIETAGMPAVTGAGRGSGTRSDEAYKQGRYGVGDRLRSFGRGIGTAAGVAMDVAGQVAASQPVQAVGQFSKSYVMDRFRQMYARRLLRDAYSADPVRRQAAKYALKESFPKVYQSAFGRMTTTGSRWADLIEDEYKKPNPDPYKIMIWANMFKAEKESEAMGKQRPRTNVFYDSM